MAASIQAVQAEAYDQAIPILERCVAFESRREWCYAMKGNMHRNFEQWEESVRAYELSTAAKGGDSPFIEREVYRNHGLSLLELQEWARAAEAFENAIRVNVSYTIPVGK